MFWFMRQVYHHTRPLLLQNIVDQSHIARQLWLHACILVQNIAYLSSQVEFIKGIRQPILLKLLQYSMILQYIVM